MSANPPEKSQPRPLIVTAALREAVGLLLLLLGVCAVLVAAYRLNFDLGLGLTGVLAIGAGATMTIRRA